MGFLIVRYATCFNPMTMVKVNDEVLNARMKKLTMKLVSLKLIHFQAGDKASSQFTNFIGFHKVQHEDKSLSFDRKSQRLDDFFFQEMKKAMVMKIVFTLSHGQASVECGFNDNNIVLKQNQKDDTIVARKLIKNYLSANNLLPHTVTINQKLVKSVKFAWRRYTQHLDDEKEKEKNERRNGKSEQLKNELIALNSQCDNLEDTIQSLDSQFIELARKAQKRNQLTFLIHGSKAKK